MPKDPFELLEDVIEVSESEFVKPTQVAADVKKKLIRLDDIALTEDGKVTKTKLFKFLKIGIEDYGDLAFDAEEAQIISRHLRFMSTGLNAVVPIYCGGEDRCPFADMCPFVRIKKVPVARICPVESSLMQTWTEAYLREFQVDPDNISDLSLVQELAELDIYDRRASFHLRKDSGQQLTQEQPVGIDNNGEPIYQTQVHVAWDLKERIKSRKLKVLEALVGTRKEKYKRDAATKQRTSADPSTEMAEMRKKLELLRQTTDED